MTKRQVLVALGFVFGLSLIAYAVAILDGPVFWSSLRSVQVPWLVAAIVAILISMTGRAWRWHLIGADPAIPRYVFWRATSIGYLGNFVLPFRAGEIVRIWVLSRLSSVSLPSAATSSILDRVTDMATICFVFVVVFTVHGSDIIGLEAIGGLLGAFAAAILLVTTLVFWRGRSEILIGRIGGARWKRMTVAARRWIEEGLAVARRALTLRRGAILTVFCLAIFSVDFLVMWFVMAAFGWALPFLAAATLGVFLAVGSALPAAPGYVGIYQVASILALQIYGIQPSEAVAYSIVLQFITFSVFVLVGGWSIMVSALPVRALLKSAITKSKPG